jgi:hypothetical protein
VASIRVVYQTPKILRSPLCAVADHASSVRRKGFSDLLKNMSKDEHGEDAMRSMGLDSWIAFEPGMLKK